MTMLLCDVGDQVRLTATFTDAADAPVTPTTITLTIRKPDGTIAAPITSGFTIPTTGTYSHDLTTDQPGKWSWRWAGTGAAVAATEGTFRVDRSALL